MSAVPPLQALTESAQKGSKKSSAPRATKGAKVTRVRRGKRETLSFDEDARRDFLTGFSKRKQQRKQAAHDFVQKKIREEIRSSRQAAAEARRRQAEENLRAERRAFGLDDEEEEEEMPTYEETDFETDERRAHVTVQELNLDDLGAPPVTVESLPPSSRRAAKKQDAPPPQAKASRAQAKGVPSGSLTAILEPEVAQAAQGETMFDVPDEPESSGKPKKQYYLSKAEREKERRKQREWNHTQAEKRRAEKGKVASAAKKKRATIRRHS
ncbi:hypothetical protein MCAP1_003203 [Malassezia caprae]|uniref:Nucleolar protein 12 n=1 Tax=Malassezia caprae TaxID=1381934 RepID=A0AAF0IY12_9BASI|nr:hypothetical protein MCAP1_003203 [Malassezia caprae]